MIKMMPISPSSLNLFKQCSRKYQARYITKEFKPRSDSEPLRYGLLVHEGLEHRLKYGTDLMSYYTQKAPALGLSHCEEKFKTVIANTKQFIVNVENFISKDWKIYVEMEAATDGNGHKVDWWSKDCFMRAKIDLLLVSPDKSEIIICDYKTGKGSSINPYQLDFIGMVLTPEFGLRKYGAIDFLVDSGEIRKFEIDTDIALPKYVALKDCVNSKLLPTIQAIKDLNEAYVLDKWPVKENHYCKWCELTSCLKYGR